MSGGGGDRALVVACWRWRHIGSRGKNAHVRFCMCACMCSQTRMCACMCSQTRMNACMCSKTFMCAHMCPCMCSQSCMWARICACMYSQTCMGAHRPQRDSIRSQTLHSKGTAYDITKYQTFLAKYGILCPLLTAEGQHIISCNTQFSGRNIPLKARITR